MSPKKCATVPHQFVPIVEAAQFVGNSRLRATEPLEVLEPIEKAAEQALQTLRNCLFLTTLEKTPATYADEMEMVAVVEQLAQLDKCLAAKFRPHDPDCPTKATASYAWSFGNVDFETNTILHRLNDATVDLREWVKAGAGPSRLVTRPSLPRSLFNPFERAVNSLVNVVKVLSDNRGSAEAGRLALLADASPTPKNPKRSTERGEGRIGDQAALRRLLSVFTDGLADDRLERAASVLHDDSLTTNEKLTKIDDVIRLPAKASAEQLGQLVGKSKQMVLKTPWWIQNRKGEKNSEIGRRQDKHRERAEQHEPNRTRDEDD